MRVFVDSNIPMYVAGREHPHREPSRRFLARVQSGEVEGHASTEVLREILYRYASLGRTELGLEVYDLTVQICTSVLPVALADTDRARSLLADRPGVSVRDAVHAAVMMNHGIPLLASFDRGFDAIPGIERLDL